MSNIIIASYHEAVGPLDKFEDDQVLEKELAGLGLGEAQSKFVPMRLSLTSEISLADSMPYSFTRMRRRIRLRVSRRTIMIRGPRAWARRAGRSSYPPTPTSVRAGYF